MISLFIKFISLILNIISFSSNFINLRVIELDYINFIQAFLF